MKRYILLALTALLLISIAAVQTPMEAATKTVTPTAIVPTLPVIPVGATLEPSSTGITGKVLGWVLVIHQASNRLSAKVALLKYKTIVNVLGISKSKLWLYIQASDGTTGWVNLYYVTLIYGKGAYLKNLPVMA